MKQTFSSVQYCELAHEDVAALADMNAFIDGELSRILVLDERVFSLNITGHSLKVEWMNDCNVAIVTWIA
jgi:hypothetical protein